MIILSAPISLGSLSVPSNVAASCPTVRLERNR